MAERLLLLRQIAETAGKAGDEPRAGRFKGLARDLQKPIESLRRMVLDPRLFGHESER